LVVEESDNSQQELFVSCDSAISQLPLISLPSIPTFSSTTALNPSDRSLALDPPMLYATLLTEGTSADGAMKEPSKPRRSRKRGPEGFTQLSLTGTVVPRSPSRQGAPSLSVPRTQLTFSVPSGTKNVVFKMRTF
jgi:hypothetical protein